LSYRAFMAAMKGNSEVKRFYWQSLQGTHSRKHARLKTQRKILSVMLAIWKKGDAYKQLAFNFRWYQICTILNAKRYANLSESC